MMKGLYLNNYANCRYNDKEKELYDKLNLDLQGKVVDKIVYRNCRGDRDKNFIIIVFTDNTYIRLAIKETEDYETGYTVSELVNDAKPILEESKEFYNMGVLSHYLAHIFKKYDWKPGDSWQYYDYINAEIDSGIVNALPEEEVIKLLEKESKHREEIEYQEYLRLKAKYEK